MLASCIISTGAKIRGAGRVAVLLGYEPQDPLLSRTTSLGRMRMQNSRSGCLVMYEASSLGPTRAARLISPCLSLKTGVRRRADIFFAMDAACFHGL